MGESPGHKGSTALVDSTLRAMGFDILYTSNRNTQTQSEESNSKMKFDQKKREAERLQKLLESQERLRSKPKKDDKKSGSNDYTVQGNKEEYDLGKDKSKPKQKTTSSGSSKKKNKKSS